MRIGTFIDGTSRHVCVERDGRWHLLPPSPLPERERILAALADPRSTLESPAAGPLPDDSDPAMPYRPARDVFCLGKNYLDHAEEFSRFNEDAETVPAEPVVFTKGVDALCGPSDDLVVPPGLAGALDYEAELVAVIGRGGSAIGRAAALDHVAAYSVLDDVTARDLQRAHAQWYLGKSVPHATPWGPVLVTPDELQPFDQAGIGTRVNGEERQRARLGEMIVSVAAAIASISRVVTLLPGDLIAMGTPAGVGAGYDPPRYLEDGDEVTCWVEGIGELRNRVVVTSDVVVGGAG